MQGLQLFVNASAFFFTLKWKFENGAQVKKSRMDRERLTVLSQSKAPELWACLEIKTPTG